MIYKIVVSRYVPPDHGSLAKAKAAADKTKLREHEVLTIVKVDDPPAARSATRLTKRKK